MRKLGEFFRVVGPLAAVLVGAGAIFCLGLLYGLYLGTTK